MAAATATHGAIRDLAERALVTSDGLTIMFTAERYGDLNAATHAARAWQIAFCSMRARERRRKIKHVAPQDMYAKDPETLGRYDALGCQRLPLPAERGWKIILARSITLMMDLDVIDNATGLPLADFGQDDKKLKEVIQQFAHMGMVVHGTAKAPYDPLTKEDRDWFVARNWEDAYQTYNHWGVEPNPVTYYTDSTRKVLPPALVEAFAAVGCSKSARELAAGPFGFSGVPVVTHNDPKLDPANIPEDIDIFSGLPLDGTNPEG